MNELDQSYNICILYDWKFLDWTTEINLQRYREATTADTVIRFSPHSISSTFHNVTHVGAGATLWKQYMHLLYNDSCHI